MAVTVNNLILGPGALYRGILGAAEPADAAVNASPAASAWTDCGGTMDGLNLVVNQEYTELVVDQIVDSVGRRITKREIRLETKLAEPTLANLQLATNGSDDALTTGTGFQAWEPETGNSAVVPNYFALLLDGWAPLLSDGSGATRRAILRKCLSVSEITQANAKEDQAAFEVAFFAHYVSSGVKPIHIVDQIDGG